MRIEQQLLAALVRLADTAFQAVKGDDLDEDQVYADFVLLQETFNLPNPLTMPEESAA